MQAEATPDQQRACRTWREARTGVDAWRRFRHWLARATPDDDGDAPWWTGDVYSSLQLWTGAKAKRLVLFQKLQVMNDFLPDGRGSDWATRWRIATATAPFAPRAHDVALIRAHARLLGGPVGFVGDLDPHGLHTYGALRSGNLDAPNLEGQKLAIEWFGIDDEWLRRIRRAGRPLTGRLIRMGWVEREYWGIIKRLAPRVRALVGEDSFELLEGGLKAETDAFRDVMVPMLRARLKRLAS
jgi:hypothetical protein